ncbi:hypothetical protein [Nocardiopsis coralliicola]
MNWLVNIVLFGLVGAVMMAALLGIALVLLGRAPGKAARVGLGAATVALMLGVPGLAAADALSSGGFPTALASAFAVAVIVYAVNVALFPAVLRRAGRAAPPRAALSPGLLAGGVLVCAVLALAAAGIAAALT